MAELRKTRDEGDTGYFGGRGRRATGPEASKQSREGTARGARGDDARGGRTRDGADSIRRADDASTSRGGARLGAATGGNETGGQGAQPSARADHRVEVGVDAVRRERARETVDDVAGSNRGRTKRCNDARDVSRAASDDDDVATSDERRLVCEFPCVVVAIDVSDSTARGRGIVARAPGGRASARVFVGLRPPRWWRASMTRNRSAPRPRFARTRARRSTRPSPIPRRFAASSLGSWRRRPRPRTRTRAARARGWTRVSTTLPRRALSARRRWTRSSRASARSTARGTRACVGCASRARSARRAWWPTRSPPPASPTATPP